MPLPGKLTPAMDFHIVLSRWVLQLLQDDHVSGFGTLIAILHVFPRPHGMSSPLCDCRRNSSVQRGAPQRYIGVGRSVVPVLERQRGKCCCTLRFRPQYSGGCLRSEAATLQQCLPQNQPSPAVAIWLLNRLSHHTRISDFIACLESCVSHAAN